MDSSDEEDVHQCGRCKDIFHSIDEYFVHKKSKVCKKPTKDGASGNDGTSKDNGAIATEPTNNTTIIQDVSKLVSDALHEVQSVQESVGTIEDTNGSQASKDNANLALESQESLNSAESESKKVTEDDNTSGATIERNLVKIEDTVNSKENLETLSSQETTKIIKQEQEESTPEVESSFDEDSPRKRKRKARPKKLTVLSEDENEVDDDPEFTPKKPKAEPVTGKRKRGRPPRGQTTKKKLRVVPERSPPVRSERIRQKRGRPPKDLSEPSPESRLSATVTVFACPLCTYTTEFRDELDRHLRRQHKMSLHNCDFCKKSFSDKYKLQKHLSDGKCQMGNSSFLGAPQKYDLDTSVFGDELVSEDDGEFTLEEEQQRAKSKAVPLFKCYECDEIYDSFLEIHAHLLNRHYDERKCNPAICEFCGKWFGSRDKFWRHLTGTVHDDISDEDVKRIKNESFNLKFFWKPTQQKKPNQKIFECDHCDKTFKYREAFNKHIKFLHPEDGKSLPYKFTCSSCNEQFNHRRTYLTHLKSEHGIKDGGPEDFKCQVCDKKFKQKAHKYRHMESLHSPVQIVPDSFLSVLESQRYLDEIEPTSLAAETEEVHEDNSAEPKGNAVIQENIAATGLIADNNKNVDSSNAVENIPTEGAEGQPEAEDEGFSENTGQTKPLDQNGEHIVELKLDREDNEFAITIKEKHCTESNSLQEDNEDQNDKRTKKKVRANVTTWLSCPVCCEKVTSRVLLLKHMQLHRVWILRTEKGIATEGVQGVFDALNLRMPNIPPGLTDRETGLAIQDVLVQKTSQGIAIPQPEGHFNTAAPTDFNSVPETNTLALDGSFIQDALPKEAGLNTIDESVIRDLVEEEPKNQQIDSFTVTTDRAVIYKAVQKTVQEIKIKQLMGGNNDAMANSAPDNEGNDDNDETSFVCPFCVQVHKSLVDCYHHVTTIHSMMAAFQCIRKGCRQVFVHIHDYEKHAEEHNQCAFICRVCNFHFEEMLDAVSHKSSAHRSHHHTEVNRCDLCNRTFASKEALAKHVALDKHHHQCEQCGKVMKTASDLKDHEMTHRGIRSYLCDQCGAAFANKLHLSRHRRLHNVVPKCLQCDQCTATFAKREHLKRHLQTQHTDEKPFACQYPGCDKAFKRKDKLQDHYRMHSNETPYQCAICGKAYRYREALKYHEKTHLKECKHFCTMCDAGFPRPAALRAHLKEKHQIALKHQHSYPCPQCGNVFSRPERLKRHMEFRHSVAGEWKFKCPVCSRGCAGKKSFKSHMLKKHSLDGSIEQLMNMDVTPFMSVEKQRRKRQESKIKIEMPMAQPMQLQPQQQHIQVQQQQQQQQQQLHQQQHPQQQQQQMQIRVDDSLSQSVAATILQPQQTHQSITINHQDPGGTIYLIPSNISDKDPLVQNMVGFQQLVLPTNAIQSHPAQTQQINTQHSNQAVIHNTMQNVTLTGATPGLTATQAGSVGAATAPLHTVLMAAHPTIQRPEATTASINLQQVTSSQAVQPHNTFSTISSSYTGFTYDQY